MSELPTIMCAVCGTCCERVTIELDVEGNVAIIAQCHGATDRMELSARDLYDLGRHEISAMMGAGGVAFARKAIEVKP